MLILSQNRKMICNTDEANSICILDITDDCHEIHVYYGEQNKKIGEYHDKGKAERVLTEVFYNKTGRFVMPEN